MRELGYGNKSEKRITALNDLKDKGNTLAEHSQNLIKSRLYSL